MCILKPLPICWKKINFNNKFESKLFIDATSDPTEKLYTTKLQNNVIYRITKEETFVNTPCKKFRITLFLTSAQYKL